MYKNTIDMSESGWHTALKVRNVGKTKWPTIGKKTEVIV